MRWLPIQKLVHVAYNVTSRLCSPRVCSSNPVILISSPFFSLKLIDFCSKQPAILISEHSTVITDGMAPKQTEELFVKQAEVYNRARPWSLEELDAFVASLTPSHELAWDVSTGSGQDAALVTYVLSCTECATAKFTLSLSTTFHLYIHSHICANVSFAFSS